MPSNGLLPNRRKVRDRACKCDDSFCFVPAVFNSGFTRSSGIEREGRSEDDRLLADFCTAAGVTEILGPAEPLAAGLLLVDDEDRIRGLQCDTRSCVN